jgi:hypothetical protein
MVAQPGAVGSRCAVHINDYGRCIKTVQGRLETAGPPIRYYPGSRAYEDAGVVLRADNQISQNAQIGVLHRPRGRN